MILALCAAALPVPAAPAGAAEPTLAAVKKRGELVCGSNGLWNNGGLQYGLPYR